jgi:hypothetical protein
MFVALRNAHFAETPDDKRSRMRTSAMGRKQPAPVPAGGITTAVGSGAKWVAAISKFVRVVAAIQQKIVAAIRRIWRAHLDAAVAFVASISECHTCM